MDYLAVFMFEYNGFMIEYIWDDTGFFADGSMINICDIPGAVRIGPEERIWADFNCWGPVVSADISIQCSIPGVKEPFPAVVRPGIIDQPDPGM